MGKVCERHQEFYETQCRWCPPPMEYRLDTTLRYRAPKSVALVPLAPQHSVEHNVHANNQLLAHLKAAAAKYNAEHPATPGGIDGAVCDSGLVLPALPPRTPDPDMRADVAAAIAKFYPPSTE